MTQTIGPLGGRGRRKLGERFLPRKRKDDDENEIKKEEPEIPNDSYDERTETRKLSVRRLLHYLVG